MCAPVLPSGPGNEIPAQVVHRDDLGRNIWFWCLVPNYFPGIAAMGEMKIANVFDWPYWSTPVQACPHLSFGVRGMKRTRIEPLQAGERA